jgi:TPR repeat protein
MRTSLGTKEARAGSAIAGFVSARESELNQILSRGFRYFRLAADQGDPQGQAVYADCLENAIRIGRNLEEAMRSHKLDADQGDADTQAHLIACISNQGAGQLPLRQHPRT